MLTQNPTVLNYTADQPEGQVIRSSELTEMDPQTSRQQKGTPLQSFGMTRTKIALSPPSGDIIGAIDVYF